MSSPLLANKVVRSAEFLTRTKPFTAGSLQLVASPRNDFVASDTMSIYVELGGLTEALKQTGSLSFAIVKESQPLQSFTRPLKDYFDSRGYRDAVKAAQRSLVFSIDWAAFEKRAAEMPALCGGVQDLL